MFDNIGGKIKLTARLFCYMGILASFVMAIVLWANRNSYDDGLGFVYLIAGPVISWTGSFLTYGFGELIERVISIDKKLKNIQGFEQSGDNRKPAQSVRSNLREKQEQSTGPYYSNLPNL